MSDVFVWDGNIEQTYGPENGTQTLQSNAGDPFSRTQPLTVAAPGHTLTLQPTLSENASNWIGAITVTGGGLIYDGSQAYSSLVANDGSEDAEYGVIHLHSETRAALEFLHMGHLALGSGSLGNNCSLIINNPESWVTFGGVEWLMSGDCIFYLNASQSNAVVRSDEIDTPSNGFVLSDQAALDISAKNLDKFAEINISTKDDAAVTLSSTAIGARSPLVGPTDGPFITLNEGNARVSIQRLSGGDPVDLSYLVGIDHAGNSFARGFNFVGNASTNTSVLTLDFAYIDESGELQNGNNGFGRSWLWKNNLVSVNGVPQNTESKLRFVVEVGKPMTIKFG